MGEKGANSTMKFLELSKEQQRIVLTQASAQTCINVNLAEKDWWISLVLAALYKLPSADRTPWIRCRFNQRTTKNNIMVQKKIWYSFGPQKIMILFLFTMFMISTWGQTVNRQVQWGETFASIAARYGISETDLRDANPNYETCYTGLTLVIKKKVDNTNKAAATSRTTTDITATSLPKTITFNTTSVTSLRTSSTTQVEEYTLGVKAYRNGDYEIAMMHFNKSMEAYEHTKDTVNETYANLLNHIGSSLYHLGKPKEAIPIGKRALNLYERLFGKSFSSYAEQCINLATYYYAIGQYGMSVSYENFAIQSFDRQGVDYFSSGGLDRLKVMYNQAESEGIDIKMGFSPKMSLREVFDTNVTRQWEKSNDLKYLQACEEIVDNLRADGDSTSLYYLHAIDELALAYIGVNDAANAIEWISYGGSMKNELCGEQSVEAARSYYIYALATFASGNIVDANDRADVVLNILEKAKEHDNETYLNALMLSCSSYLHMGVLGTAGKQGPRLVEIADSLFGIDSRQYDAARFLYAQCLFRLEKDAPKVISLLRECLDWRTRHLGDSHPDTVNALIALANFLSEGGDSTDIVKCLDEAERLYDRFYRLQNENVKNNFLSMSLDDQRNYWRLFEHYYLELIPRCSLKRLKANGRPSIPSGVCYNAALFGKGILLNSETLMREALQQSHNGELLRLYNEIAKEKMELMNLLSSSQGQESAKSNTYRSSIGRKQQQLARSVSSFNDYTSKLSIEWKDVQKHLGEKDVAIEFIHTHEGHQERTYLKHEGEFLAIPSGSYDEDRYAAVILTQHSSEPVLLSLFDINDIGDLYFNGVLREQYLCELLWKPILEVVGDGIKNIYFSPTGALHSLPIESLMTWDGNGLISDRVNLYRISSSRLFCLSEKEKGNGSVIYGGLDYDATIKELKVNASLHQSSQKTENTTKNPLGSGLNREAMEILIYLKGTKEEADFIHSLMQKKKNVTLLDGNKGTEESFKALNGKKKRLIHIGTHGFFDDSRNRIIDRFGIGIEDISMMNSGLYMAGANNYIKGEDISNDIDDGVLTSAEIASLDLRGLDMVSLSACQTALGEVTGDGVFGLQRGFKKAGANSILMSLWKVDDEATYLLMTEFYKNWMTKRMTKHDSLEQAKQIVRSHKEKGWDNPRYWAAFILLDALD